MSKYPRQGWIALMVIALAGITCNLPSFAPQNPTETAIPGQNVASDAATATLSTLVGATPLSTEIVAASATPCTPIVVANSAVNVHSGPGTEYEAIGSMSQGGSAAVAGKNDAATWWYIAFPGGAGGHAWVSGSVVTASCIPASLAIIAAPPAPLPASGACKDGYVYRLIKPSDKVCVTPASKSQADADNAAADSRWIVNVYGNDACISGYVWREAFSGDHVCVTPAVRSQAAADNAAAASRWTSGAYGPHTCISGCVWREATGDTSDDVCVTPEVRSQAAADNAAASSRVAVNVYGPDACVAGYVWREAFSGDHVCVTPEVRSQVAADNAAAPSHTWP